jgi:hypothetical protein
MISSGGDAMPTLYSGADSRGVAQLVARGVWDAEVGGSSPLTPTMFPFSMYFPVPAP